MNDLDAVRKRPGMYVGDVADGTGLHRMVYEVVDNAINEALAGYCDRIEVTLDSGGSVTVRDNGRGIPTDIVRDLGVSAVEVVMTRLHRATRPEPTTKEMSGSLRGVGLAVVNALSDMLEVRVWRQGKEHFMRFRRGEPEAPLAVVGNAAMVGGQRRRGTQIAFVASARIFGGAELDLTRIERRLREISSLNCGAMILLSDRRSVEQAEEIVLDL